jgi:transcriptional regulator
LYIPSAFARDDVQELHAFMERHSFATLATHHADGRLIASHLPLMLLREGRHGVLFGHVARANDQWRDVSGDALAIFAGPHAYVSPRWYEAKEVVPTWNYAAVHAYGPLELIADRDEFQALLARLIDVYESGAEQPWTLERSGDAVEKLLGAIVGFRIPIRRLEGKWKLSQNHPRERQEKVIHALEAQGGQYEQAIAAMMRGNLEVLGPET